MVYNCTYKVVSCAVKVQVNWTNVELVDDDAHRLVPAVSKELVLTLNANEELAVDRAYAVKVYAVPDTTVTICCIIEPEGS